jgi:hypothetical protein
MNRSTGFFVVLPTGDFGSLNTRGKRQMKTLAFTTAIALALATAAYAQGHHGGGGRGPGPGMGGGGGPGLSAPSGGGGPSANFGAPRGPSGFSNNTGPGKGPSGSLYNSAPTKNMNAYKQGGQNLDKDRFSNRDRDRFSDRDNGRRLYNRADRDHDFDHGRNFEGSRDFQRRGIARGDFFEHATSISVASSTANGCS